jgi:alkaline phosphatase D
MKTTFPTLILLFLLEGALSCLTAQWTTRGGKNYGVFAPEEAWLEGDSLPYFGSENEWSRRMFEDGPADRFYKRRGQRQMLAILDGKPELAVVYSLWRQAQDPGDPEVHYMLSLAYAALSVKDTSQAGLWFQEAESSMKKALELGMSGERYVAGPRSLAEPLQTSEVWMAMIKTTSPLVHGPMLGNAGDSHISCWVRTREESMVQMLAWIPGKKADTLRSEPVRTREGKDYTAVMDLQGLKAGSTYLYIVSVDGKKMWGPEDAPQFNTAIPSRKSQSFTIAFGGGAGFNPEAEKVWTAIQDVRPDALFLLGDNVYVDLPEMPGPFHDYTYYRRYSRPEFRALVSQVPVYTIWDDHDAGIDDVWLGPYRDRPAWKQPMVSHYRQNWVNPGYGSNDWPGCWYSFRRGDIEVFMLDGRTYRTCPFGPEPTMLGPVQKEWLLEGLKSSRSSVKVLVSPVPWNFRAKPGSHDTWAGFEDERKDILDLISEESINGVVLMSADRHRSEVWEVEWNGPYPLYEFLSSRLTNMHFHDKVPGAIYSYNDLQSFGLLEIKTEGNKPEAIFKVVNLHGEEVYEGLFPIGR